MRVVEIGCGSKPGPLFEGAAEHILVDPNPETLEKGYRTNRDFIPFIGNAANIGFLADSSVDTILARNVFGDPCLGLTTFERLLHLDGLKHLAEAEKYDELEEHMNILKAGADLLKVEIMREAGRILLPSGRLVVIEQQTPKVAGRFFDRLSAGDLDFDTGELFYIEHGVALEDVTPPNYATVHGSHPELQTWVVTKR